MSLRVLGYVHKYPPAHGAGAEWMLHSILRRWAEHGDRCQVCYPGAPTYTLDGVSVFPTEAVAEVVPDVVITHLDRTRDAVAFARQTRALIVHLVHNGNQLTSFGVSPAPDTIVAFNSRWLAESHDWPGEYAICRPHVRVADYALDGSDGAMATLCNVSPLKGSTLFYALVQMQPWRRFLAVEGVYGWQDRRPYPNVEWQANTPRMRDEVYARTRVLLMPSRYESWGRCAIEAACSGIPTVAAPTHGLVEALGEVGIFRDDGNPAGWSEALTCLDDEERYACHGAEHRQRALALERVTLREVDDLRERVGRHRAATVAGSSRAGTGSSPALAPPSGPVAALLPWRADREREQALDFTARWWAQEFPGIDVRLGPAPDGPWSKGAAVHAARLGSEAAVLIVADADVIPEPAALRGAIAACQAGQAWAVPFRHVWRLDARSTGMLYDGTLTREQAGYERHYDAVDGGGMTVLRAEVFDGCPMDPRFLGWGGEDAAWGQALRRLYGPPAQFDGALTHLWHVHQVARIVGGTIYKPELPAASDLLIRYGRAYAEGEPAMRALVDEARATLAAL